MKIIHPQTTQDFQQRNKLLQKSLRETPALYPIEEEYPIVLNPLNNHLSFCVTENNQIIGHANLWPRYLYNQNNQTKIPVALIGNVATDEKYRGRGIMKFLFDHLSQTAEQQEIQHLILWSDLIQFYQKLGFTSFAREERFTFSKKSISVNPTKKDSIKIVDPQTVKLDFLDKLQNTQIKTINSLIRSSEEFKKLLQIPDTTLLCHYSQNNLQAYAVLGKGYDMIGILHEWGARSVASILLIANYILENTEMDSIELLSPKTLNSDFISKLSEQSIQQESHAMAFIKKLTPQGIPQGVIDHTFIWGLDSI